MRKISGSLRTRGPQTPHHPAKRGITTRQCNSANGTQGTHNPKQQGVPDRPDSNYRAIQEAPTTDAPKFKLPAEVPRKPPKRATGRGTSLGSQHDTTTWWSLQLLKPSHRVHKAAPQLLWNTRNVRKYISFSTRVLQLFQSELC